MWTSLSQPARWRPAFLSLGATSGSLKGSSACIPGVRNPQSSTTRSIDPIALEGERSNFHVSSTQVLFRDGIQGLNRAIPTAFKVEMIHMLALAGFRSIEAGSCVKSPVVLADSVQVIRSLRAYEDVIYDVLIPNLRGWERLVNEAMPSGGKEAIFGEAEVALSPLKYLKKVRVSLFTGASEGFVQANIGCSIDESFHRFDPVVARANQLGVPLRGYLSCMTDCPKEGSVEISKTADLVMRLLALSADIEVVPSDTTGRATARQVSELIHQIKLRVLNPSLIREVAVQKGVEEAVKSGWLTPKNVASRLALHLHGQDLERVDAGLAGGVHKYDSALADLGGCPVLKRATGNLNSIQLLEHLDKQGFKTGIDLDRVKFVQRQVMIHLGLDS